MKDSFFLCWITQTTLCVDLFPYVYVGIFIFDFVLIVSFVLTLIFSGFILFYHFPCQVPADSAFSHTTYFQCLNHLSDPFPTFCSTSMSLRQWRGDSPLLTNWQQFSYHRPMCYWYPLHQGKIPYSCLTLCPVGHSGPLLPSCFSVTLFKPVLLHKASGTGLGI